MTYADALQSWRDFYVTAGAAAATLVGLLFVGLSLHIRVVVLLLVVTVRNTWDLLVTVADRTGSTVGPGNQDGSDVVK